MKQIKGKQWVGCMILLAGILAMFSTTGVSQAAVRKPCLSQKKLQMVVGKQDKVTVKHKKGYVVSWKSSKKTVATVSKTGKIKAKRMGNTKITAIVKQGGGGRSYHLVCKVSVKQIKKQENSAEQSADRGKDIALAGNPSDTEMETETSKPTEQSGSAGIKSEQSLQDQGAAGQTGLAEPPEVNQTIPDQPFLDAPAGSVTGSAVTDGDAKLLFGNYNDAIWNENFLGNQRIVSYEQLQDLIVSIREEMLIYGDWKLGYDKLQWYVNQLEEIGSDYFANHVLYIHTMSVARGYDYTLDSAALVMRESGKKELYLNLKRHYNLKKEECVTCDMPYYSFFMQVPRELVQDCESVVCSLVSDNGEAVPSDEPDNLYMIQSDMV